MVYIEKTERYVIISSSTIRELVLAVDTLIKEQGYSVSGGVAQDLHGNYIQTLFFDTHPSVEQLISDAVIAVFTQPFEYTVEEGLKVIKVD